MNNKGFTLIELLAVIVILAIIALIATPIILGIIKDAKAESNKRSIDGYASALKNAIANEQIKNPNQVVIGKYETTDGRILKQTGNENLIVEYDGNVICDIIQIYEDGNIYLDVCKVNNEVVKYTYGIKQGYDNGEIVYFDVDKGIGCTEEEYNKSYDAIKDDYLNSETNYNGIAGNENQNSCLKFYAFLDDGSDKINLLLDHNIIDHSSWIDKSSNKEGPIKALKFLKQYTNEWSDKILTPSNYVYKGSERPYFINYKDEGYKARLITAQEIAEITGAKDALNWDELSLSSKWYYFQDLSQNYNTGSGSKCASVGCTYAWLYDRTGTTCVSNGCLNNTSKTTNGYWTASAVVSSEKYVWTVGKGSLSNENLDFENYIGIRPVIEVYKSCLK